MVFLFLGQLSQVWRRCHVGDLSAAPSSSVAMACRYGKGDLAADANSFISSASLNHAAAMSSKITFDWMFSARSAKEMQSADRARHHSGFILCCESGVCANLDSCEADAKLHPIASPGTVSELLLKIIRQFLDCRPSQLNFPYSNRVHNRLSAGYRVEFGHCVSNNLIDRALAQTQDRADLPGGLPNGNSLQHFTFACRQSARERTNVRRMGKRRRFACGKQRD